ncbi:unnamed protein product, partial [Trichobilharzia szidati]
ISSNSPNSLNYNHHSIHEVNYIHLYSIGTDQSAVNCCDNDDEYTQSIINPGYTTEFDPITHRNSNTYETGSECYQQSVYSTPSHGVAQSISSTNETQLMPGSNPCQMDYDIWTTTTTNEPATPVHQPSTAYTVHYPINDLSMEIFDSSSNHYREHQDQPQQQHTQVQYFNTYEIFDNSQHQLIANEQFTDKSTDYIDFVLNSNMNQSTPVGNCCLNQSNYQIQPKMIGHFGDDGDDLDAEQTNEKEACSLHSANNNNWSNQCLSHTSLLSEIDRNEENLVERREENEKPSEIMMHP